VSRRVDFLHNTADLDALVLAELGFSTKFIEHETDLTPSQITYRLHKVNVKRADYRNGGSVIACYILRTYKREVTRITRSREPIRTHKRAV